jgi:hypothetical protein
MEVEPTPGPDQVGLAGSQAPAPAAVRGVERSRSAGEDMDTPPFPAAILTRVLEVRVARELPRIAAVVSPYREVMEAGEESMRGASPPATPAVPL